MTTGITDNHIEGAVPRSDITHAHRPSSSVGNHRSGGVGGTTMPGVGQGTGTTGGNAIDGKGDFIADPLGSGIAGLGGKAEPERDIHSLILPAFASSANRAMMRGLISPIGPIRLIGPIKPFTACPPAAQLQMCFGFAPRACLVHSH